eukprot:4646982-Prymnesium_polylepis.1
MLAEPARKEVVGVEVLARALLALLGDVDSEPGLVPLDGVAVRTRRVRPSTIDDTLKGRTQLLRL